MRPNESIMTADEAAFAFLCCCATGDLDADIGTGFPEGVGSERLLAIANRHGMLPLLMKRGRGAFDEKALGEVGKKTLDAAVRGLHLAGELARLMAIFQRRGLKAAPYKGPVLAAELYGNLATRGFCDLDLLIDRADLEKAEAVLREEGYTPEAELPVTARESWLEENCELNFNSADGLCHVELHWSPLPPRFGARFDVDEMLGRLRSVSVSGKPVPSLAPEDMLLVLCAHGFKHFWTRLFWIVDVAMLLRVHCGLDWDAVFERAGRWRCRRMLLLGTALAERLLEASLPERVREAIAADAFVRKLTRDSEEWLLADWDAPRPRWSGLSYALAGGEKLRDRLPMWRHVLVRAVRPNERDRQVVELPGFLSFGYWLIRPFRLLRDYGFRPPSRRA